MKTKIGRDYRIIGIDEVGRGPLAGPVTVAALLLEPRRVFPGLKDSKKLSEKRREAWFRAMRNDKNIFYAVSSVSPRVIDEINVAEAANRAATQAFRKLANGYWSLAAKAKIYLDGGLYLNKKTLTAIGYTLTPKTLIKGDEKINAIKLASIVAKVSRDRYMCRLHKKYPHFGFAMHKGYGTKSHFLALRKHPVSKFHRLTFLRKFFSINSKHQISEFQVNSK